VIRSGRGAAWQRASFGTMRSEVQILSPRPKPTNLAVELENRRQRGVEPQVDRIRRELVFEPLEPQDDGRRQACGDNLTSHAPAPRVKEHARL
jgi:hypothetical protein